MRTDLDCKRLRHSDIHYITAINKMGTYKSQTRLSNGSYKLSLLSAIAVSSTNFFTFSKALTSICLILSLDTLYNLLNFSSVDGGSFKHLLTKISFSLLFKFSKALISNYLHQK